MSGSARNLPSRSHQPSFCRLLITVLIVFVSTTKADDLQDGYDAYLSGEFSTAYRLLSPAATIENPALQNLVGLMLYRGQGISMDAAAAHELFHNAADRGIVNARRNLGVLHTIGPPGIAVDIEEAMMWFTAAISSSNQTALETQDSQAVVPAAINTRINPEFKYGGNGKRIYLTFCSGCHGFNGMRFFSHAPSFAMGERLTTSAEELMQTILRGKGLMPSWEDKLSESDLEDALGYLRELALRTGYGTDSSAYNQMPEIFYIFEPPGTNGIFMLDLDTDMWDTR
jgi:mono/diheme cytochrome c family protein